MQIPEKFLKFLELVKDQLFYNSECIVVFDEDEYVKKGSTPVELLQNIEYLENEGIATKVQRYHVAPYADLPATSKGRKAMLSYSFRHLLRVLFSGRETKMQIAILIDKAKFDDFCKNLNKQDRPEPKEPLKVDFLQEASSLKIGNRIIKLPPFRNEFEFCRVMFGYLLNEPVDWEVIYKDIELHDPKDQEKAKRKIYDTYLAINKRVREQANLEDLFIWQDRTVRRQY